MIGHALRRTSLKGKGRRFLGTCVKCGAENLPAEAVSWECANIISLTDGESILVALSLLEDECRLICEEKGYDPDYPAGETRKQWEVFTELGRARMAERAKKLIAGALSGKREIARRLLEQAHEKAISEDRKVLAGTIYGRIIRLDRGRYDHRLDDFIAELRDSVL